MLVQKPAGYLGWFAVFSPAWMKVATLTFIASLLYHAWVGVRDIWMDYVKPTGLRLVLDGHHARLAGRPRHVGAEDLPGGEGTREMALTVRKFDAVIVGAGGAGPRGALQLSEAGAQGGGDHQRCSPTRSHTVAAQGGVGASLGNMGPDSWAWHMYDTVKGGDWLTDQDAAEFLAREATKARRRARAFRHCSTVTRTARSISGRSAGTCQNMGAGPRCAFLRCAADRTGHAMLHTPCTSATCAPTPSSSSSGWAWT